MSRLDTGYDDDEDDGEDSVEEVIDCRDTNGARNGMRRSYNSTDEMIEIDMEMEDTAAQNGGSRIKEFSGSPSSASSVKARRRQNEEDGMHSGHGLDGGSPVPGLQVGPSVQ